MKFYAVKYQINIKADNGKKELAQSIFFCYLCKTK